MEPDLQHYWEEFDSGPQGLGNKRWRYRTREMYLGPHETKSNWIFLEYSTPHKQWQYWTMKHSERQGIQANNLEEAKAVAATLWRLEC